jgi:anti-sigma B factor antagonist
MTISTIGTDVVVALIQDRALDAGNSREFRSAVEYLFKPGAKLVFDLSELEFIDSTGIGALVSCLRQAHGSEAEIRLCALNQSVQAVFDLVRLNRVFEIYNNPVEAINSYPNLT